MARVPPSFDAEAHRVAPQAELTSSMGGQAPPPERWACPVCGGHRGMQRFPVPTDATEGGVDPASFRPSSDQFGRTVGTVLGCLDCGHGSLATAPPSGDVDAAYGDAVDEVSEREERGLRETAARALRRIEAFTSTGRLLDVGCWTGILLDEARARGWDTAGIEPSRWASDAARARGLDVSCTVLDHVDLASGSYRAIVIGDVLEHLRDPAAALDRCVRALEPGGVLFVTVPDAGSRIARVLGRRWWSVLPMHLQYFTRASLAQLLVRSGLEVVEVSTHPKAFSVRYYLERLTAFAPPLRRPLEFVARAAGSERLVAPDLRDRMAVVALKR